MDNQELWRNESILLAGLIKYPDIYADIWRRLLTEDLDRKEHQKIYHLIQQIRQKTDIGVISKLNLITTAAELDIALTDKDKENVDVVFARPSDEHSVMTIAKLIKKRRVIDHLQRELEKESNDVEKAQGTLAEIVGGIEDRLFSTFNSLGRTEDIMMNMAEKAFGFVKGLVGAPPIGLDLGFPNWQRAFGKVRNGSVHGIFARMKQGKSQLALQLAVRAMQSNIPVLLLDTELGEEMQMIRLCAQVAKVPYEYIEEGTWVRNNDMVKRMTAAEDWIAEKQLMYADISGQSIQEAASCIRKFALKYNRNPGHTPKCLCIYDYVKLPDISMLATAKEYQILGAVTSKLHDEALKLKLPMFIVGQQNRAGAESDSNITIADSDKMGRDLDSLSVIRRKTERELSLDSRDNGTHMLKVIDCRSGPGHTDGEYVNLHFDMSCGNINEGEEFTYEKLQFLRSQVEKSEHEPTST